MTELKYIPFHLDILCIGQMRSGKSSFLKYYTQDQNLIQDHGIYTIYAKKIKNTIVYFHELSQQQNLFLEKSYDGILFFVDFFHDWNSVQKILKWMEQQSKSTGANIYKIPIKILITNIQSHEQKMRWKENFQQQLKTIVNENQIIYVQKTNNCEVEKRLQIYFEQIIQGKAQGINPTNKNHIRLYGLRVLMKLLGINVRLTFWRCYYLVYDYFKYKPGVLKYFKRSK